MNPERWRRIDELFQGAVELPPAERTTWLEQECGGDRELHREVRELLASDGPGEEFVEEQVKVALLDMTTAPEPERRAGPYRLLRVLGRGGMGTVYLGERADDEYEGRVAVKLIRPGFDTDFFLARFRRERQTLARLQHPNIARLLDSGSTADGMPYIVMEYIDGPTINEYCADRNLSITERLELFLPVCAAVTHAHQNFVIHRDLKPGNILVDSTGTPKLLDFGICKLVIGGADETLTNGPGLMTPDYASPEQVRADPITISSDVYSLGAVLFELLTGERPHRIDKLTPQAIERAICDEEVRCPSSIQPALRGDIDTILLKAMQKDPARRYSSVEQLSNDIRSHLECRPVSARPDSLTYRFAKFSRRNRGSIFAVASVVGALAFGLVLANREARRAQTNFVQTRKLANSILFEIHDQVRDLPGSIKARKAIVRLGLDYLDTLASDTRNDDPELRRELATGYERLGEVQGNLAGSHQGDPDGALASHSKALTLLAALKPTTPVLIDRSLNHRHMASIYSYTKRRDQAVASYEAAIAAAADGCRRSPEDREALQSLAESHSGMSRLLRDMARYPEARGHILETTAIYRRIIAKNPEDISLRASLATAHSQAAGAEIAADRLTEARDQLRATVAEWDEICRREPANQRYRRDRMLAYGRLADTLASPLMGVHLGDVVPAREAYRKMLAEARRSFSANPNDEGAITDLGMALFHAASIPWEDPAERLAMFAEADRLLSGANATNSFIQVNRVFLHNLWGEALEAGKDYETARAVWNAGLTIGEAQLDSVQISVARAFMLICQHLGEDAARRRDGARARAMIRRALLAGEHVAKGKGASVPQLSMLARSFVTAGEIEQALGNTAAARDYRIRAREAFTPLVKRTGFSSALRDEYQKLEARLREPVR